MEFLENKHHMQAFLSLAESKLKSWIIKYGQQESVELMLHSYIVSSVSDLCSLIFRVHLHAYVERIFNFEFIFVYCIIIIG